MEKVLENIEDRYSRHAMLTEVGEAGQRKIENTKFLVLGAGGLGSPACLYLASAGVGKLTIVDNDTVDLTNLQRQIIHNESRLGIPKALSAQISTRSLNSSIEIEGLVMRPDRKALESLVESHDVVLDCTDNTDSRYLLNEVCRALRKPLVTAGAVRFDGQLTVFDFRKAQSPCYACVFPNHEGKDEKASSKGVFAPLVGTLGCMQAAEALKIAGNFGKPLVGKLLIVDLLSMTFSELKYGPSDECPLCGKKEK
ncbi:MAG: HesA/MoeB/ThiF family protein [Burkholderiales bacterium]|nr:HesA/MoeB/ThiF family protein [Burkholderiales bacterium]